MPPPPPGKAAKTTKKNLIRVLPPVAPHVASISGKLIESLLFSSFLYPLQSDDIYNTFAENGLNTTDSHRHIETENDVQNPHKTQS